MTLLVATALLIAAWFAAPRKAGDRWERLSVLTIVVALGILFARLVTPGTVRTSERVRLWAIERLTRGEFNGTGAGTESAGELGGTRSGEGGGEGLALRDTYDLQLSHDPKAHVVFSSEARDAHPEQRRIYLRRFGFQRFDGRVWFAGKQETTLFRDADDGVRDGWIVLPERVIGPELSYTVVIRYAASHLPYMPSLCSLKLPAVVRGDADVYRRPVPAGSSGFSFEASSTLCEWRELPAPSPASVDADSPFLQLPAGALAGRIGRLAEEIAGTNSPPASRVESVLDYFRGSFEYSLTVRNPRGLHPMENFIFEERRGHCQLFASAFVLVLRAAGIPARMAAGYCGGEFDPREGVCTFFGDDAHAWAEVLVADYGWVVVDPTPSASPLAPRAPRSTRQATPVPDVPRLADTIGRSPLFGGSAAASGATVVPLTLIAGSVLLVCALSALFCRSLAGRKSDRGCLHQEGRSPSFLRQFLRHFRSRGYPMRRGQTLLEYMQALRRHELIGDEFDDMADYVYGVSYAGAARDRAFEKVLRSRIARLK